MDVLHLGDPPDTLWHDFFERENAASAGRENIHAPVVERWKRVRNTGLSPEGPSREMVLTAAELENCRGACDALVSASRVVFEESARLFAEHHFVLLLTDADGVVLLRTAGGDFQSDADAVRLIEGAAWSEPLRGTNAIGTALIEERPVGVVGRAHYVRPNHSLACYASPIRSRDGTLIGAVDATSRAPAANPFIHLAVLGVARSIEAQLYKREMVASLQALVDRIAQPAMVVSASGQIACQNAPSRAWMAPAKERLALTGLEAGKTRVETENGSVEFSVEPLGVDHFLILPVSSPSRTSCGRPLAHPFSTIFGNDPILEEAKHRAARFATSDLPVLLLAETGTGKELMAHAIHQSSPRRHGPFVALNCGALSAQLLETELFGYADGAFTGAAPGGKPGKLSAAHRGTLFLDEIAEMPHPLQALLLRVLEYGTYHRVGEHQPRQVDLRLVCATCRDLRAMVEEGNFRRDLYFRIRGACIGLPPLRSRSDLLELAEALLEQLARKHGRRPPKLSKEARARLLRHDWPGNVRELKTALDHALVLADEVIAPDDLPSDPSPPTGLMGPTTPSREDAERHALLAALGASAGNLSEAARRLGVARSTLYRMMERLGLQRKSSGAGRD